MKHYTRYVITLITMLSLSLGAWADPNINIVKQLNGTSNDAAGEVSSAISNSVCTLTVTPAEGNYLTVDYITAYSTVSGNVAQVRKRAPGLDNTPIEVSATSTTADPSGVTTYTFNMPDDGSDVEVTVNFQSRTALTEDMVTLSETSFTYNGTTQKPEVTVEYGDINLNEDEDYTLTNEGGITVNSYNVIIEGKGKYKGEISKSFNIIAQAITNATVTLDNETSLIYNGSEIHPNVTKVAYTPEGATTEKVFSPDTDYDVSYSEGCINVGEYTVTATFKGNYSGTASTTFNITQKSISGYTVAVDATQTYTYTGSAIEPAVTVTPSDGGNALVAGTDYTVSYSNNINAATANDDAAPTVTVTGTGNYTGTEIATFNITQADLDDVTIGDIADQTYDGEDKTPTLVVKLGDNTVSTDDYTVTYTKGETAVTEIKDAGTYTVTLTSSNKNFSTTNTKSTNFTINAATATLNATSQEVTYNGESQEISGVSVTAGTAVVTYYSTEADRSNGSNALETAPKNAGTYYVRVTQGNANYTSTPVDVTFTINKAAITDVTLAETSLTYTGAEQTVAVNSVKAGTLELSANDYTVSGNTATTPGTYTVTVTAADASNYSGSKTAEFNISSKALTDAMITDIEAQTYDGTAKEPELAVKDGETALILDTDYTVAYTNNTNAGTATATITGKGNYSGTATKNFTINKAALSGVTITAIADQTYTGAAIEPSVTVTFNDNTVDAGEYTVGYNSNINVGQATVTLTAADEGNFTGTATANFNIVQADITPVVTIEGWYVGDAPKEPSVTAESNPGNGAVTYEYKEADGETFVEFDIAKNQYPTAEGTYVLQATVSETGNYRAGVGTVEFTISKRVLDISGVFVAGRTYATYYNPTEVTYLPEGIVASVVTSISDGTVVTQAISYIPKDTPVLLESTSETIETNDNYETNLLGGSAEATDVSALISDGAVVYVLYKDEFLLSESGTIPANRAYLYIETASGQEARRLSISGHNGGETGIGTVAGDDSNGENWYDMSGRKLDGRPAKKGLYLKNGLKVVIK